jgi:hypothetical protein
MIHTTASKTRKIFLMNTYPDTIGISNTVREASGVVSHLEQPSPLQGSEPLIRQDNDVNPLVCVITGTHSSGKSTLLGGIEQAKIGELGVVHQEYDDFGYGIVEDPESGRKFAVITVPEAARWLAYLYARPDFLAESYNFDFQLAIDAETVSRIYGAMTIAKSVVAQLVSRNDLAKDDILRPVILSDRGPLDGLVYSDTRLGVTDVDVAYHRKGTRVGFTAALLASMVDSVIIADHTETPFDVDDVRLDDIRFRDEIAKRIAANYRRFMPEQSIIQVEGDRIRRKEKVCTFLASRLGLATVQTASLPYSEWNSVELVGTQ